MKEPADRTLEGARREARSLLADGVAFVIVCMVQYRGQEAHYCAFSPFGWRFAKVSPICTPLEQYTRHTDGSIRVVEAK